MVGGGGVDSAGGWNGQIYELSADGASAVFFRRGQGRHWHKASGLI